MGAAALDRNRTKWWVLVGVLPMACAGAEIENGGTFTGGLQTATEAMSDTVSDDDGDDDDDDATVGDDDATVGDGSVDDDGSGTQGDDADSGSDGDADADADADGPEDDGTDDASCVPAEEVCDGVDNDCDDAIDEDDPQAGTECQTGMPGACAAGTNACADGALACVPSSAGGAETCNGVDDDCDGTADQGNPGGGGGCSTGQPGVCGPGTNTCQSGGIVCVQNVGPSGETCNGADDNCDGGTDEGNPGGGGACATGLAGVCSAGTLTCSGGGLACAQNVGASGEACFDGLDNDCDGTVDNGCGCAHDVCVAGVAMANGCSPCVTSICAADPFCCSNSWDGLCVSEASSICLIACQGSCTHSPCVAAEALIQGCDAAGCVSSICATDPFCCSTSWDGICVGEVGSICGLSC
jgi:hypothetical protein